METPKDRGPNRSIDMDVEPTVADAIKGLPGHGTHHNDGEPADQPPSYMDKVRSGEYDPDTIEDEGASEEDNDNCPNCGAEDSWEYSKGTRGESETGIAEGYGRTCSNCKKDDYSATVDMAAGYMNQEEGARQRFLEGY